MNSYEIYRQHMNQFSNFETLSPHEQEAWRKIEQNSELIILKKLAEYIDADLFERCKDGDDKNDVYHQFLSFFGALGLREKVFDKTLIRDQLKEDLRKEIQYEVEIEQYIQTAKMLDNDLYEKVCINHLKPEERIKVFYELMSLKDNIDLNNINERKTD